jgi:VanZ family protein
VIPGVKYKTHRKGNPDGSILSGKIIKSDTDSSGTISAGGALKYKNLWRSIAYLIIIVIIVLSLIPDPDKLTPFSASDKLMHTLAYAVSMLWFGLCFKREKLPTIGAGLIFLGIALEIIQGQTGYRSMSIYDIIANCVGVFIGLGLSFSPLSRSLRYLEQRLLK